MINHWRHAYAIGLTNGLSKEDAEDFASYVVERLTKNPNLSIVWHTMLIDFKRLDTGKSTSANYSIRLKIKHAVDNLSKVGYVPYIDTFDYDDLPPFERCLVILRFKWGFTYEEIGDLFGVSARLIHKYTEDCLKCLKQEFIVN